MHRAKFGTMFLGWTVAKIGAQILPPRTRRPNPFPINRQIRLGDYWAVIDITGTPPDLVETVSISLTTLPGRSTEPANVWTILTNRTGLLEPLAAIGWTPSVVYERGGQPRFVIIRVPLNSSRGAWIFGHWWFKVNNRLPFGAEVNIERQIVYPADSLTLTLADRTTGFLL